MVIFHKKSLISPGADWDQMASATDQKASATDQKAPATFHTKNPKGYQNSFKRPLFGHFVWEIVKAPATSILLLLWPVRPCILL
jgi:hypothetical protein